MPTRLGYPIITSSLLKWLRDQYKPRCYDPKVETLEEHLKFGGKVDLVAWLGEIVDQQREDEDAIAALAREEAELADTQSINEADTEAVHVAFHSHRLDSR